MSNYEERGGESSFIDIVSFHCPVHCNLDFLFFQVLIEEGAYRETFDFSFSG